ncbi:MAG TPA: hypothetical protein VFX51_16735 [Solirubrobacteraceae bacterium]|nr:hypothetical protein [Solirubrobacteraceae bacterium]
MTAFHDPATRNGHHRLLKRRPGKNEPAFERVELPFLDCGPELVIALGSGRTEFQDLVLAFFLGREDEAGETTLECSPADGQLARDHFNVLVRNFERTHGHIRRSYFARYFLAAAALTSEDEIEVVLARDVPSSELIQIIRRAQALGYMAWHRLEQYDKRLCQGMIFSVILEVLRRLDHCRKIEETAKIAPEDLDQLRRNLDEAEDFMLRCAKRQAQTQYMNGMLTYGSAALVLLLAIAGVIGVVRGSFSGVLGQTVLVAIAGAFGAAVSVMWRQTSGTFTINLPTLGSASELRLMGALRPAIGAVFALAVFVFAMSPILPLEASTRDTYLVVALGFLAGFSERFAQDMFARSGQQFAAETNETQESGLSAGLAPLPSGAKP